MKFIEANFDFGSLGATDARSDDLSDFFNYDQPPRRFRRIKAPLKERYFLNQPLYPSARSDDNFLCPYLTVTVNGFDAMPSATTWIVLGPVPMFFGTSN